MAPHVTSHPVSTGDWEVPIPSPQICGRLYIAQRPRAPTGKTTGSYVSGRQAVGWTRISVVDEKIRQNVYMSTLGGGHLGACLYFRISVY